MKTLLITQIANNFRKRLPIAKTIKVQHLSYMYNYSYSQLLQSFVKSFFATK